MNIRGSLFIFSFVTSFLGAPSAWADWAQVGAAYKCTKSTFALYATVESSAENIPAPSLTKPLKVGNNHLSCNVGGTRIVALVNLTGPGRNGACGDPGVVGIWKMQVGGTNLIEFGEPMAYCNREPSIVSVEVSRSSQGVSTHICKGVWNWGSSYENVQCESKQFSKQGKLVANAKAL